MRLGKLVQGLEDRVVGRPPKVAQPAPAEDDDWPEGTVFDAQGRPVFIPDPGWKVGLRRLLGTSWVSRAEWEADMSRKCGRPVTWEDSGPGSEVGR